MPQVLDLNDTLVEMIPAIRRIIGEHISLSWTPGSTVGQVIIDPAQLRQILTNLCLNAREAVSVSGKITLGTDRRIFGCLDCAHYAEATPGEFALITVGDNGCGMNRETLEHLFEPFFSTRGVGEGSGLGLATVYGIVKQNNGFVNVHSEPGQGSTFEIYLPHHAEIAEKPRQTLHPPPLPRAQGEQVLLVEDEPSILRLCVSILEKLGYGVLAATTPGEALRLVEQEARPIDLLFTDVIMPGMNGQELAKLLKSRYPRIKTLFMSGYTANVITHHGVLDAGVQFIQKPFSMQDLAVRIRRVLDNP